MKTFYRRNLPHIQPLGASFFITFRLVNSVPVAAASNLSEKYYQKLAQSKFIQDLHKRNVEIFNLRKRYLEELDDVLHKIKTGPHFLRDGEIIRIIGTEIKKYDGILYHLIAYSIMSNHVHLVIDTGAQIENIENDEELIQKYLSLDKILQKIKGATSRYINLYLSKTGQLWHRESFDIYIRNEKMLENVINYTLQNPVKAGLVKSWEDYEGNYFVETSK